MVNSNFGWVQQGLEVNNIKGQLIPDKSGKCCLKVIIGDSVYRTGKLNKGACNEFIQALVCNNQVVLNKYKKQSRQVRDEKTGKKLYTKHKNPTVVRGKRDDDAFYINGSKYSLQQLVVDYLFGKDFVGEKKVKDYDEERALIQYFWTHCTGNGCSLLQTVKNYVYSLPDYTILELFKVRRDFGCGRSWDSYLDLYKKGCLIKMSDYKIMPIGLAMPLVKAWCGRNQKDIKVTKEKVLKLLQLVSEDINRVVA
jgi:hypothetical protein